MPYENDSNAFPLSLLMGNVVFARFANTVYFPLDFENLKRDSSQFHLIFG